MSSELIPSIPFSTLKKLNAAQVRELKCLELTSDGEYLGTLIVPQTDYVRTQADYMGQLSNSVGGKTLEEIEQEKDSPAPVEA